jgi:D-alanyl-D-alanine carboxypeptidase
MKYFFYWALFFSLALVNSCGPTNGQGSVVDHSISEKVDSMSIKRQMEQEAIEAVPMHYLLGTFDQAKDSNFVQLQSRHSAGSARGAYLQKEAYQAFVRMHDAAKADGINLTILSATRNFDYQKGIWEAKWNGKRKVAGKNLAAEVPDFEERALLILRYSSMPGTSRHHWGTDIDINNFENSYFASGKGKAEYDWLVAHAAEYGFCQPYTAKGNDRPHGYEEERWHWSYMPLAKTYLKAYQEKVDPSMIKGFAGAEVVAPLQVIERYVSGVNSLCK